MTTRLTDKNGIRLYAGDTVERLDDGTIGKVIGVPGDGLSAPGRADTEEVTVRWVGESSDIFAKASELVLLR